MKKIITTIGLTVAMLGLGLFASQQSAQAKSSYSVVKSNWYAGDKTIPSYPKSTKKAVWMWNASHTKHLHNLSNYPTQSFNVTHSLVLKHNNTKALYYQVSFVYKNKTVKGYVWHKYLNKGINPKSSGYTANSFSTTTNYRDYIKQSPDQKLANSVRKLFPSATLDLGASQLAIGTYGMLSHAFTDDGDRTLLVEPSAFTDVKEFKPVENYLYKTAFSKTSNATKLAQVKKLLAADGYTTAKLKKLQGYKLGLAFETTTNGGESATEKGAGYALILAKTN